jgi:hypothetical protein
VSRYGQELVLQLRMTHTPCYWRVGHESHLQELQLKRKLPKKRYEIMGRNDGAAGCGSVCEAESDPHRSATH